MVIESTTEPNSQHPVLNNDNCPSIFQIPCHLVKSCGEKMPSKVTLKAEGSDKKWIVSIEKFKDYYFFTDGWKEFAQAQVDLKSLDFLNLNPADESKIKGSNKRKISVTEGVKETSSVPNEDNGTVEETSSVPNEDKGTAKETSSVLNEDKGEGSSVEKVSFCRVMKEYHRYRVDMPNGFAVGIGAHKDMEIKLTNGEGREWPIHVTGRVRDGKSFFTLNGGWSAFVKDNKDKLMVGSTISFTWLSGNMVQTEISGAVTDSQSLSSIVEKRRKCVSAPAPIVS